MGGSRRSTDKGKKRRRDSSSESSDDGQSKRKRDKSEERRERSKSRERHDRHKKSKEDKHREKKEKVKDRPEKEKEREDRKREKESRAKEREEKESRPKEEKESRPKEEREKESRSKEEKEKESRPKEEREKESRSKEEREKESRPKEEREKESRPKEESRSKEEKEKESRLKEEKEKESRPKEEKESRPKEEKEKESRSKEEREKESRPKEEKEKESRSKEEKEREREKEKAKEKEKEREIRPKEKDKDKREREKEREERQREREERQAQREKEREERYKGREEEREAWERERDEREGNREEQEKQQEQESDDEVDEGDEEEEQPKMRKSLQKSDVTPPEDSVHAGHSSGDVVSLSIEETNIMRAKLGLKPLQLDKDNGQGEAEEDESVLKKKDVHVPPKNIGSVKLGEKLKEKMEVMKEARKIAQKLHAVKTLGEAGDTDEEARAWVEKMRVLAKEKELAEKRAQVLAEMDEEFGVSNLVDATFKHEKEKAYTSKDLKGIKVEHKAESFKEGRSVILTLKDSGVLEEGEDVLMNVNLLDAEKAAKSVENARKKPDYNPYEEEEVDELGNLKRVSLLKKYDEEIDGVKQPSFTLGDSGEVDTSEDRERAVIRQRLKEKEVTLQMVPPVLASSYYTPEEMVKFKKSKKVRKKQKFRPDDLLPLAEEPSRNLGSRDEAAKTDEPMDIDVIPPPPPLPEGAVLEEDRDTLSMALLRTRRLLKTHKGQSTGASKVMAMLQEMRSIKEEPVDPDDVPPGETIVMDTTAEFCRHLGEDEDQKESTQDSSRPVMDEMEMEMEASRSGGWMEVDVDAERIQQQQDGVLYQEEEPSVAKGVTAALQMATRKGFLEDDEGKREAGTSVIIEGLRDRDYERERDRERERDLLRNSREVMPFAEKKDYKPKVKIEYVDNRGRLLDAKEAFREMSHKFHGKGSGKKKLERRMKKVKDDQFMKKASSVDTPLNTLAMLQAKQKNAQTPYLVLSGGSQSMLAPDLEKRK